MINSIFDNMFNNIFNSLFDSIFISISNIIWHPSILFHCNVYLTIYFKDLTVYLILSSDCPWGDSQSWCKDILDETKKDYGICASDKNRPLCCASCAKVKTLPGHSPGKPCTFQYYITVYFTAYLTAYSTRDLTHI